jgi:hypothetical protein
MTCVAESAVVVASAAFESLVFCVQSVRIQIVEIMYVSREIIAAMTFQTGITVPVALHAPVAVKDRPGAVLMAPFSWVNVRQGEIVGVTDRAIVVGLHAVMTRKALAHGGRVVLR